MYTSITHQFVHIFHYAFAVVLIYGVLPKFVFSRDLDDRGEDVAAGALQMVLLLISAGYVLVLFKLFEVLAILMLMVLMIIRKKFYGMTREQRSHYLSGRVTVIYDFFEGNRNLKGQAMLRFRDFGNTWRERFAEFAADRSAIAERLLFLAVLGVAAYIRFHDAFTNAAPALSDGNVTLSWIKYLEQRILFNDGIYPQGFHLNLAVIRKLASIDALYVLKYSGPLAAMLTMLGYYFFVSRTTGLRTAGIVAAGVFGLLGQPLFGDAFVRQAATNSQEFGFAMILPTLYFACKYLEGGSRAAFRAAVAGMAATGLIHAIAYGLLGLGIGILLGLYMMVGRLKSGWRRGIWLTAGGAASIPVALAPVGIGFLLGRKIHTASAEYATSQSDSPIDFPELHWVDWMALTLIGLIVLFCIGRLFIRRGPSDFALGFSGAFAAGVFMLHYVVGPLTGNTVIISRSVELWAFVIPLVAGMAWFVVTGHVGRWLQGRSVQLIFCAAVLVSFMMFHPPKPLVPYKMTWSESVEQYLQIRSKHPPDTWIMFSDEQGYALALGEGRHEYIGTLLERFNPDLPALTRFDEAAPDRDVPEHIYIFEEKQIYRVSEQNSIYSLMEPVYIRKEQERERLRVWLEQHKASGHAVDVVYEDDKLKVHYIHRKMEREEVHEKIWGGGGSK